MTFGPAKASPFEVVRKGTSGEYIGRPSPLGNPFYMNNEAMRDLVCDKYKDWFEKKLKDRDPAVLNELRRLHALGKQGPVKLVCYCAPRRCHGDTIKAFLDNPLMP